MSWSAGIGNDVTPPYPFFVDLGGGSRPSDSSGMEVGGDIAFSRDVRRFSLFHGPGESLDKRGDGSGVRSPMAVMTGLATTELAAEAEPNGPYNPVFRLGVLDIGRRDCADEEFRSERPGRLTDRPGVVWPYDGCADSVWR